MSARPIAAASRALCREIREARRVGGGDINDAWRLTLDDGTPAFLKSRGDAPAGEYEREAAGLAWLTEAGGLQAPEVLAVVDDAKAPGLVLEWVEPGHMDSAGEEELGRGLAATHAAGAERFDARPPGSPDRPLRFGGVELPDGTVPPGSAWATHYAARLETLSAVALDSGRISPACSARLERVCERIDGLAGPPESPARVHGDLWSGNVLADSIGRPWLIDPAAHGAHRELDLAMLELFGSVTARTHSSYAELKPLAEGYQDRVPLWQLQPLLVHAILFGGFYGAAVDRAASRYA